MRLSQVVSRTRAGCVDGHSEDAKELNRALASGRFGPYEAGMMLGLCGHNLTERAAAVETIVAAVAAGKW